MDERDALDIAHDRKVDKHLEEMEAETYDNFRALGFSKGESMKAANNLRKNVDDSEEIFREKIYNETGVDPGKE